MPHPSAMMQTQGSPTSVLILGGAERQELIAAALSELDVRIDRLEGQDEFGRGQRRADLVLVDRALLDGPQTIASWLDSGVLDGGTPLLLTAPSPMDPGDYREWLEAGIWEVVRLPVDPALLSLRLKNLLGGRVGAGAPSITPMGPYPWPALVRATEETLALGRRYGRPVSCVALAVEAGSPEAPRSPRLMYRLGVAAQEWVRGSDLVGLSEHDVLLAVLPDTTGYYADILGPRLVAAVERSLKRAGFVAGLRSATVEATTDRVQSAPDFLLAAVRQVTG
jgi:hypothetical protein